MKHFSKYLFGLYLGLNLVLSALPGQAQASDRVSVTVPFDFVVGDKQLKAGDYIIESVLGTGALSFRSKGGAVEQIAFSVPIETNQTGHHERLLFRHEGDQYFLSQVWFWRDEDGRELIPGGQEKGLGRNQPATNQAIAGQ